MSLAYSPFVAVFIDNSSFFCDVVFYNSPAHYVMNMKLGISSWMKVYIYGSSWVASQLSCFSNNILQKIKNKLSNFSKSLIIYAILLSFTLGHTLYML